MIENFDCNSTWGEQRRLNRAPLAIDILVREKGRRPMPARLIDLNEYGCQVDGIVLIRRDPQLWVRLPGLEGLPVNLVWQAGSRFGLELITPLHPSVVARFMPRPNNGPPLPRMTEPAVPEPKISRREQILAGIATVENSPLHKRKQQSGLGLIGRISRIVGRNSNHRAEPRCSANTPLRVGGSRVRVIDVSASGLRIAGWVAGLEIGSEIKLDFPGFAPLSGQLVWSNGLEAGIALPPLSIDLVDQAG